MLSISQEGEQILYASWEKRELGDRRRRKNPGQLSRGDLAVRGGKKEKRRLSSRREKEQSPSKERRDRRIAKRRGRASLR